jgi:hypothetical protein
MAMLEISCPRNIILHQSNSQYLLNEKKIKRRNL